MVYPLPRPDMKIKFLIYLVAVFGLLSISQNVHGADSAEQMLSRCAKTINSTPSISMKFVLSYDNLQIPCDITVSKNKYHLSSKDMQVWYDGNTQWTYLSGNQQLSISEPTTDELLESNPFAIVNHYSKAYTCKKAGSDIELIAKSRRAVIKKARITINPSTDLPTKVVITMSNGKELTASAGTVKKGPQVPSSTFIYSKKLYPAKEIVDLR